MRKVSSTRIHWRGRWFDAPEIESRIDAAIAGLGRLGVREGDAVGICVANSLDWVAIALAVGRIGAVLVPLNPRLSTEETSWQIARAGVVHLFADGLRSVDPPTLLHSPADAFATAGTSGLEPSRTVDPRRPQTILFTSGTTGRPKAAILTRRNHRAHVRASVRALSLRSSDRWLLCMPLFHVGGLNIVHRCLYAGAGLILHDGFDPDAVNRAIDGEGATIVSFVETMLRRVIAARGGRAFPAGLRAIVVGGGPIAEELIDAGPAVLSSYGLTESCSMATLVRPGAASGERHSAGPPLPGLRVRIVDETGRELPAETEGSIEIRGPVVMKGYLADRTATRSALRSGWLRTGDIGLLDPAGCLHVAARREDLILSAGENIYPAEIEAALRLHPEVADLVVIGVADAEWGQRPLAVVVAHGRPPRPVSWQRSWWTGSPATRSRGSSMRTSSPACRTASRIGPGSGTVTLGVGRPRPPCRRSSGKGIGDSSFGSTQQWTVVTTREQHPVGAPQLGADRHRLRTNRGRLKADPHFLPEPDWGRVIRLRVHQGKTVAPLPDRGIERPADRADPGLVGVMVVPEDPRKEDDPRRIDLVETERARCNRTSARYLQMPLILSPCHGPDHHTDSEDRLVLPPDDLPDSRIRARSRLVGLNEVEILLVPENLIDQGIVRRLVPRDYLQVDPAEDHLAPVRVPVDRLLRPGGEGEPDFLSPITVPIRVALEHMQRGEKLIDPSPRFRDVVRSPDILRCEQVLVGGVEERGVSIVVPPLIGFAEERQNVRDARRLELRWDVLRLFLRTLVAPPTSRAVRNKGAMNSRYAAGRRYTPIHSRFYL